MIFTPTSLKGAYIVDPELAQDERGAFARTFCQNEFRERGLKDNFVQCNTSFNKKKGTLRGMHYQAAPHEEAKLVRCTGGAIYDVIVDLRPDSSTYKQWTSVELTAANRRALYIPEGLAHGFQTLCDDSEVFYQMSEFYYSECARGFRWNDPTFVIQWPISTLIMSNSDRDRADYSDGGSVALTDRL
jgi:dTDP-4-dehydrorhamnose 3,5-epimerase